MAMQYQIIRNAQGQPSGGKYVNVPDAPTTQQLVAAPGSFTGTSSSNPPFVSSEGYYTGRDRPADMTGFQAIANPNYRPGDGALTSREQYLYKWTGEGVGGAAPGSGSVLPGSNYPTSGGGSTIPGGGSGAPSGSGGGASTLSGGYSLPTGAGAAITANPWSLASNSAAVNAGNASGQEAGANFGQAYNMRTGANSLQTGAGAVMDTAFDPQNALYDRTAQQLQDQVRVSQAARGTTMSPYGAGVENKAMSDFNIDWQNAKLDRQTQGLGAAGTAMNSAGTANVTGANLGQQGVGQEYAAGNMPWQDYTQQQNQNIQNWIAYMNQANAATSGAMQNYPNQLAQQSMLQGGGVPYIPQSSNTFSFA